MTAAAELLAVAGNADNTDNVTIFFTKECHSTGFLRFFDRHFTDIDRCRFEDFLINDLFDGSELLLRKRFRPCEVEAQTVRKNERAGLIHLIAKYAAKCCLQHVCARMVSRNVFSSDAVNCDSDRFPFTDDAFRNGTDDIDDTIWQLLRVFDLNGTLFANDGAGITDLSAAFCMERVVLEDYSDFGAVCCRDDLFAILAKKEQLRFAIFVFRGELFCIEFCGIRCSDFRRDFRTRSSCSFLLLSHGRFEAFLIDGEALFLGDLIGQFPWEAIGIIKFENLITGKNGLLLFLRIFQHFRKQVAACIQRGMEAFFFDAGDFLNESLLINEFRIGRLHHLNDDIDHLTHEGILNAQKLAKTNGTAQYAAEDIASAFIRRKDAVSDHIRDSTRMVRNDLQCHITLGTLSIGYAGKLRSFFNDREKQVGFKVILFLLKNGSQTFQTCTGIDVLLGKRQVGTILLAVVLGEYKVPDLKETISVSPHLVFRIRAEFFALIKENFRVRAAWAFPDFPEVIGKRIDMVFRQADHFVPVVMRFIVIGINGDVEAGLIELQDFGQEFPCPGNRFLLEIIAKGEIPQHFEESMMACGTAYVFNISGTDTFLAGRHSVFRWFYLAGEVRLQWRHAGTDQEKAGVILWNQGETLQSQMVFFIFKKRKIIFANVIAFHDKPP